MVDYKEDYMILKKTLLKNGLISDFKILDMLMTYSNEVAEVGMVICRLAKVLDSEIIEEYEERV